MTKKLILCDCSGSQDIDSQALQDATGLASTSVHSALCTSQLALARDAIGAGDAIICCRQEQRIFQELVDELDLPHPAFADLRDRAGWSDDARSKLPKMAALLAEAALDAPAEKSLDVISEGAMPYHRTRRCGPARCTKTGGYS